MSMINCLLRVSNDELESFLDDSSLLEDIFYSEEEGENPNLIDIDKAWDGIIYLLTGNCIQNLDMSDTDGLHAVVLSGQLIDPEQDMGYGPAHYLSPDRVKKFSDVLGQLTKEKLYQNYNPKEMDDKGVYPTIWKEEGDEAFDYIYSYFEELQKFYSEAAKENQAIVSVLN